ncbi:unnamed protein product [Boreogadus saida]
MSLDTIMRLYGAPLGKLKLFDLENEKKIARLTMDDCADVAYAGVGQNSFQGELVTLGEENETGLLRGKVVEPAVRNMDPKEQQELLERIQDTDEEEKYPLLFTFDFQEDMEEVFHNMAAEEDLRVNAMFLGRWVDSQ